MKTNKLMWFGFVVLAVMIGVFLFWHSRDLPSQQADTPKETNTVVVADTVTTNNLITNSNLYVLTVEEIHSNAAAIDAAYKHGKISKAQAIQAMLMEENKKSLDFYGRVIDQYGQPVVGAKVKGGVLLNVNFVKSGGEVHYTETDQLGYFNFLGLHGVNLGIRPEKEGYMYVKLSFERPENYKPDPKSPITITMWKLRGAEPMRHINAESRIPFDGTPATFDMVTGKPNPNGDLQITLLRSPLDVRRSGQKFDWLVKVEILNGGIVEENDPYPYWAPESGYQPFFQFGMSSNNVPWDSTITQNFYIKNFQSQYGRMQIKPYASATPAGIKIDLWLNPSGSQNLEFDPAKQIQ